MERCAVASSPKRYVAISFDLKLLSDYLYHLGYQNFKVRATLRTPSISYTLNAILKLTVEAGLVIQLMNKPICTPGFFMKCILCIG